MRPDLSARIVWQPFQLNPELPPGGVDRQLYLRAKFVDSERIRSIQAALEESGRKEGIAFAFDRIRRVPNTLAAHRLMRFAARAQKEDMLAARLFSIYFEHGEDIGDRATLAAAAGAVGLDASEASEFLASNAEYQSVASADELSRQGGISGVPYFVFDRRYALAGAQEPVAFLPLFDALAAADADMLTSPA